MTEPFLIAIDPGNGTGWALLAKNGAAMATGITRSREELYSVLAEVPESVELVVMEDYTIFQHKAIQQSGSKVETARVIGAVDSWAATRGIKVVLQPASILPIAKLWSGIKPKGAHRDNHHVSALLHGYYYLQKAGYIVPKRQD